MKPHVSRCRCGCLEWIVTSGKSDKPGNILAIYPRWRDAWDYAVASTVGIWLTEKEIA